MWPGLSTRTKELGLQLLGSSERSVEKKWIKALSVCPRERVLTLPDDGSADED